TLAHDEWEVIPADPSILLAVHLRSEIAKTERPAVASTRAGAMTAPLRTKPAHTDRAAVEAWEPVAGGGRVSVLLNGARGPRRHPGRPCVSGPAAAGVACPVTQRACACRRGAGGGPAAVTRTQRAPSLTPGPVAEGSGGACGAPPQPSIRIASSAARMGGSSP